MCLIYLLKHSLSHWCYRLPCVTRYNTYIQLGMIGGSVWDVPAGDTSRCVTRKNLWIGMLFSRNSLLWVTVVCACGQSRKKDLWSWDAVREKREVEQKLLVIATKDKKHPKAIEHGIRNKIYIFLSATILLTVEMPIHHRL